MSSGYGGTDIHTYKAGHSGKGLQIRQKTAVKTGQTLSILLNSQN